MAEQGPNSVKMSFQAEADFTDRQYHLVRQTGEDTFNIASQASVRDYVGVLVTKPDSGEWGTVQRGGKQKVVTGGSTSVGDLITANGSGRATAVSSGSNDQVYGMVLSATGADGEVATVDLYSTPFPWPGIAI